MHIGNAENDDPHAVLHPGFRIVGITGDTKYKDLKREIRPAVYTPLVAGHAYFELRSSGDSHGPRHCGAQYYRQRR